MDEKEKQRKIEAVKRTLGKHKRKKETDIVSIEKEDSYVGDVQKIIITDDKPLESDLNFNGSSKLSQEEADVREKIIQLEEIIIGKESVIESLIEENEILKSKINFNNETYVEDLPVPEYNALTSVEQYKSKLDEFEHALNQRDKTISQLRQNVDLMTKNRDDLQMEYTMQIDQLTSNVHTLQSQLKEAGQWLNTKLGESSAMALLEAKNEILALQKTCSQKEHQMKAMQDALKQRDAAMQILVLQLNETTNKYTSIHTEVAVLKQQLVERNMEITKVEQESEKKLSKMGDDFEKMKKEIMEKSLLDISTIADNSVVPLPTLISTGSMNSPSTESSSVTIADRVASEKTTEEKLSALRAELDEFYGQEITKIKETWSIERTNESRRLTEEISRLEEECIRYSQQATMWQQQYVLLSQQNISSSDLVQQISEVTTENIRLNQMVDRLNAQIKVSSQQSSTSSTATTSTIQQSSSSSLIASHPPTNASTPLPAGQSDVQLELIRDELERLKKDRVDVDGLFATKEQRIKELEDNLATVNDELNTLRDANNARSNQGNNEDASIKLSELHDALIKSNHDIHRLTEEKQKLAKEVMSWQRQYMLLSQQNVSSADLVEQISSVVTENIRLNQLVNELNSKLIINTNLASNRMTATPKNSATAVVMMRRTGKDGGGGMVDDVAALLTGDDGARVDSMESLDVANVGILKLHSVENNLDGVFFTKEQVDDEVDKQVSLLKSELDENHADNMKRLKFELNDMYQLEIERLKSELTVVSKDRQKFMDEAAVWQKQYVMLSQQHFNDGEVVERMNELNEENKKLKLNVEECELKIKNLHVNLNEVIVNYENKIKSLSGDAEKVKLELQRSLDEESELKLKYLIQIRNLEEELVVVQKQLQLTKDEQQSHEKQQHLLIIDQLKQQHLTEAAQQRQLLLQQMDQLKEEHNSEVNQLKQQHQQQTNQLIEFLEQNITQHQQQLDQQLAVEVQQKQQTEIKQQEANQHQQQQHNEQLKLLQQQYEKDVSELELKLQQRMDQQHQLEEQLKQEQHSKEQLLQQVNQSQQCYLKEIDKVKQQYECHLNTLLQQKQQQQQQDGKKQDEQITQLQQQHQQELTHLRQQHQQQIININEEMQHLKATHLSEIEMLNVEKQQNSSNNDDIIKSLNDKILSQENDLTKNYNLMTQIQLNSEEQMNKSLEEAKTSYTSELILIKESHEKKIIELMETIDSLKNEIETNKNKLDELNGKYESQITEIKTDGVEKLASLEKTHETTISELELKLTQLNEDLSKVSNERDSVMDSLQNIYRERVELKQALDKVTTERNNLEKKVKKFADKDKFLTMVRSKHKKSDKDDGDFGGDTPGGSGNKGGGVVDGGVVDVGGVVDGGVVDVGGVEGGGSVDSGNVVTECRIETKKQLGVVAEDDVEPNDADGLTKISLDSNMNVKFQQPSSSSSSTLLQRLGSSSSQLLHSRPQLSPSSSPSSTIEQKYLELSSEKSRLESELEFFNQQVLKLSECPEPFKLKKTTSSMSSTSSFASTTTSLSQTLLLPTDVHALDARVDETMRKNVTETTPSEVDGEVDDTNMIEMEVKYLNKVKSLVRRQVDLVDQLQNVMRQQNPTAEFSKKHQLGFNGSDNFVLETIDTIQQDHETPTTTPNYNDEHLCTGLSTNATSTMQQNIRQVIKFIKIFLNDFKSNDDNVMYQQQQQQQQHVMHDERQQQAQRPQQQRGDNDIMMEHRDDLLNLIEIIKQLEQVYIKLDYFKLIDNFSREDDNDNNKLIFENDNSKCDDASTDAVHKFISKNDDYSEEDDDDSLKARQHHKQLTIPRPQHEQQQPWHQHHYDEEHSPTKVISQSRLIEIESLRLSLVEAEEQIKQLLTEKENLSIEFKNKIHDIISNHESIKTALSDEIVVLQQEQHTLVEKLKQSNDVNENLTLECDRLISSHEKERTKLEEEHKRMLNELTNKHEEIENQLKLTISNFKKQMADDRMKIESVQKEKYILEHDFVNELQEKTKDYDGRIKGLKENYETEIKDLKQKLVKQQEEHLKLSDEFEFLQLDREKLRKQIDGIKLEETKILSQQQQHFTSPKSQQQQQQQQQLLLKKESVDETLMMRLNSLQESKSDVEIKLKNFENQLENVEIENLKLNDTISKLKSELESCNNSNKAFVTTATEDVATEMPPTEVPLAETLSNVSVTPNNSDNVINIISYSTKLDILQQENTFLKNTVDRLTREKDQLLLHIVSRNQTLELDLSNMELQQNDDDIENGSHDDRMIDPRVHLLEAEKELLANMLEKVSVENERLLSFLNAQSQSDVTSTSEITFAIDHDVVSNNTIVIDDVDSLKLLLDERQQQVDLLNQQVNVLKLKLDEKELTLHQGISSQSYVDEEGHQILTSKTSVAVVDVSQESSSIQKEMNPTIVATTTELTTLPTNINASTITTSVATTTTTTTATTTTQTKITDFIEMNDLIEMATLTDFNFMSSATSTTQSELIDVVNMTTQYEMTDGIETTTQTDTIHSPSLSMAVQTTSTSSHSLTTQTMQSNATTTTAMTQTDSPITTVAMMISSTTQTNVTLTTSTSTNTLMELCNAKIQCESLSLASTISTSTQDLVKFISSMSQTDLQFEFLSSTSTKMEGIEMLPSPTTMSLATIEEPTTTLATAAAPIDQQIKLLSIKKAKLLKSKKLQQKEKQTQQQQQHQQQSYNSNQQLAIQQQQAINKLKEELDSLKSELNNSQTQYNQTSILLKDLKKDYDELTIIKSMLKDQINTMINEKREANEKMNSTRQEFLNAKNKLELEKEDLIKKQREIELEKEELLNTLQLFETNLQDKISEIPRTNVEDKRMNIELIIMNEKLDHLTSENLEINDQLSKTLEENSNLLDEIKSLKDQILKSNADVNILNTEVKTLCDKISMMEEEFKFKSNVKEVEFENELKLLKDLSEKLSNQLIEKDECLNELKLKLQTMESQNKSLIEGKLNLENLINESEQGKISISNEILHLSDEILKKDDSINTLNDQVKYLNEQLNNKEDEIKFWITKFNEKDVEMKNIEVQLVDLNKKSLIEMNKSNDKTLAINAYQLENEVLKEKVNELESIINTRNEELSNLSEKVKETSEILKTNAVDLDKLRVLNIEKVEFLNRIEELNKLNINLKVESDESKLKVEKLENDVIEKLEEISTLKDTIIKKDIKYNDTASNHNDALKNIHSEHSFLIDALKSEIQTLQKIFSSEKAQLINELMEAKIESSRMSQDYESTVNNLKLENETYAKKIEELKSEFDFEREAKINMMKKFDLLSENLESQNINFETLNTETLMLKNKLKCKVDEIIDLKTINQELQIQNFQLSDLISCSQVKFQNDMEFLCKENESLNDKYSQYYEEKINGLENQLDFIQLEKENLNIKLYELNEYLASEKLFNSNEITELVKEIECLKSELVSNKDKYEADIIAWKTKYENEISIWIEKSSKQCIEIEDLKSEIEIKNQNIEVLNSNLNLSKHETNSLNQIIETLKNDITSISKTESEKIVSLKENFEDKLKEVSHEKQQMIEALKDELIEYKCMNVKQVDHIEMLCKDLDTARQQIVDDEKKIELLSAEITELKNDLLMKEIKITEIETRIPDNSLELTLLEEKNKELTEELDSLQNKHLQVLQTHEHDKEQHVLNLANAQQEVMKYKSELTEEQGKAFKLEDEVKRLNSQVIELNEKITALQILLDDEKYKSNDGQAHNNIQLVKSRGDNDNDDDDEEEDEDESEKCCIDQKVELQKKQRHHIFLTNEKLFNEDATSKETLSSSVVSSSSLSSSSQSSPMKTLLSSLKTAKLENAKLLKVKKQQEKEIEKLKDDLLKLETNIANLSTMNKDLIMHNNDLKLQLDTSLVVDEHNEMTTATVITHSMRTDINSVERMSALMGDEVDEFNKETRDGDGDDNNDDIDDATIANHSNADVDINNLMTNNVFSNEIRRIYNDNDGDAISNTNNNYVNNDKNNCNMSNNINNRDICNVNNNNNDITTDNDNTNNNNFYKLTSFVEIINADVIEDDNNDNNDDNDDGNDDNDVITLPSSSSPPGNLTITSSSDQASEQLRQENALLKDRIDSLREQLEFTKCRNEQLAEKLDRLEDQLLAVLGEVDKKDQELVSLKSELKSKLDNNVNEDNSNNKPGSEVGGGDGVVSIGVDDGGTENRHGDIRGDCGDDESARNYELTVLREENLKLEDKLVEYEMLIYQLRNTVNHNGNIDESLFQQHQEEQQQHYQQERLNCFESSKLSFGDVFTDQQNTQQQPIVEKYPQQQNQQTDEASTLKDENSKLQNENERLTLQCKHLNLELNKLSNVVANDNETNFNNNHLGYTTSSGVVFTGSICDSISNNIFNNANNDMNNNVELNQENVGTTNVGDIEMFYRDIKSPASFSGSETFLMSDDGHLSCSEVDEIYNKLHSLQVENEKLKKFINSSCNKINVEDVVELPTSTSTTTVTTSAMLSLPSNLSVSSPHINQNMEHEHTPATSTHTTTLKHIQDYSMSSLDSTSTTTTTSTLERIKKYISTTQQQLPESQQQNQRQQLQHRPSSSSSSINADRFLVLTPRSLTSTTMDYQLEVELSRNKTIDDYIFLQIDFKKFKQKARSEYTKLKNRLVETLKDYNMLRLKYRDLCDSITFHSLVDANLTATENKQLRKRVEYLEGVFNRRVGEYGQQQQLVYIGEESDGGAMAAAVVGGAAVGGGSNGGDGDCCKKDGDDGGDVKTSSGGDVGVIENDNNKKDFDDDGINKPNKETFNLLERIIELESEITSLRLECTRLAQRNVELEELLLSSSSSLPEGGRECVIAKTTMPSSINFSAVSCCDVGVQSTAMTFHPTSSTTTSTSVSATTTTATSAASSITGLETIMCDVSSMTDVVDVLTSSFNVVDTIDSITQTYEDGLYVCGDDASGDKAIDVDGDDIVTHKDVTVVSRQQNQQPQQQLTNKIRKRNKHNKQPATLATAASSISSNAQLTTSMTSATISIATTNATSATTATTTSESSKTTTKTTTSATTKPTKTVKTTTEPFRTTATTTITNLVSNDNINNNLDENLDRFKFINCPSCKDKDLECIRLQDQLIELEEKLLHLQQQQQQLGDGVGGGDDDDGSFPWQQYQDYSALRLTMHVIVVMLSLYIAFKHNSILRDCN